MICACSKLVSRSSLYAATCAWREAKKVSCALPLQPVPAVVCPKSVKMGSGRRSSKL